MPGFKATVLGENFQFLVDEEPQYVDFHRTVYLDADDQNSAEQAAIHFVREALAQQDLVDMVESGGSTISIDEIQQVDILKQSDTEDFIWYLTDDDDEFDDLELDS